MKMNKYERISSIIGTFCTGNPPANLLNHFFVKEKDGAKQYELQEWINLHIRDEFRWFRINQDGIFEASYSLSDDDVDNVDGLVTD